LMRVAEATIENVNVAGEALSLGSVHLQVSVYGDVGVGRIICTRMVNVFLAELEHMVPPRRQRPYGEGE